MPAPAVAAAPTGTNRSNLNNDTESSSNTLNLESDIEPGKNQTLDVEVQADGGLIVKVKDEHGNTLWEKSYTAEQAKNLVIDTGGGEDFITVHGNTTEADPNLTIISDKSASGANDDRFTDESNISVTRQTNAPEGGQKPPEGGQKPPEGGQKPPEGGQKPPEGGQKPPEGGQKPPEGGDTSQPAPAPTPAGGEATPNANTPPPVEGPAAAQAAPPNPYKMTQDNAIIEIDKSIAELEDYRDGHSKAYGETGKDYMAAEAAKAQIAIDKLNDLKGRIVEMSPEMFVAMIQEGGAFADEFKEVGNDLYDVSDENSEHRLETFIKTKDFFTPERITSELETNVVLAEQQQQAQAQPQQAPPA